MKIAAYCDVRYEQATRAASGGAALVITCPPVFGADLPQYAAAFAQADLIYFNLHAAPDHEAWYITSGQQAVTDLELRALDVTRAVVFMVNCYAGGGMLDALKAMQPRAIVGGFGENEGGRNLLTGADLLGLWFRRALGLGLTPLAALTMAKARLTIGAQTDSVKDALQFEVLYERNR